MENGTVHTNIKSSGLWTDNFGNYGKNKCFALFTTHKDKSINLNMKCENTDSRGEKFWLEGIRKTGKERGVGTLTYVKTSEKYKRFLNKKCHYGVSWFNQDSFFLKQKCKL